MFISLFIFFDFLSVLFSYFVSSKIFLLLFSKPLESNVFLRFFCCAAFHFAACSPEVKTLPNIGKNPLSTVHPLLEWTAVKNSRYMRMSPLSPYPPASRPMPEVSEPSPKIRVHVLRRLIKRLGLTIFKAALEYWAYLISLSMNDAHDKHGARFEGCRG